MSSDQSRSRIHSMDQFRGYTVAGMFLVNFVGSFSAFHYIFRHNSGFFSYADSIMPGFIFCAGFSYRLTAVRRFAQMGSRQACWSYIRRSLALVLVSVSIYTFNADIGNSWIEIREVVGLGGALTGFVCQFLKAGMWEVLSIIGMTQILLLPVINRSVRSRLIAIVALPLLHVLASWSFNYSFANGLPNWFNSIWGADNSTVWDGGMFGPLAWSLPMLAGALTYDLIAARTAPKACGTLLAVSLVLMVGGYLTNCLSRLYDHNPSLQPIVDSQRESLQEQKAALEAELEPLKAEIETLGPSDSEDGQSRRRGSKIIVPDDPVVAAQLRPLRRQERELSSQLKSIQRSLDSLERIALDPVVPSMERLRTAEWAWADPPFVKPEHEKQLFNYWLMDKGRMVSLPFTLFSTGFNLFLYALFIVIVDMGGMQSGVFRTLGQNPLAAYIIHGMVKRGFHDLAPNDSPLWWGISIFALFFGTTLMMVRYLERHKMFLRL